MIYFEVPGQPQGKGRARVTMVGGFARAYTPEKTALYENLVKMSYILAKQEKMQDCPISMTIEAYYRIPQSMSAKKRQRLLGKKPTVKPDADNIAKVICDALNGLAYPDDKNIVQLNIGKHYAEEPHITVKIEVIDNG